MNSIDMCDCSLSDFNFIRPLSIFKITRILCDFYFCTEKLPGESDNAKHSRGKNLSQSVKTERGTISSHQEKKKFPKSSIGGKLLPSRENDGPINFSRVQFGKCFSTLVLICNNRFIILGQWDTKHCLVEGESCEGWFWRFYLRDTPKFVLISTAPRTWVFSKERLLRGLI